MTVVEYNNYVRQEYEKTKSIDFLEKYIISETLSPIADYYNAINIIRENYQHCTNTAILFIGAYLISKWMSEKNEMLDILNNMYPYLSDKEKSIVCFLNAHDMRFKNNEHVSNPQYKWYLLESIKLYDSNVNSRVYLAEVLPSSSAIEMYKDAVSHIQKIYSVKELVAMPPENFSTVKAFIDEYIFGTHISEANARIIGQKAQR